MQFVERLIFNFTLLLMPRYINKKVSTFNPRGNFFICVPTIDIIQWREQPYKSIQGLDKTASA